jgi:hypothetical protein
MTCNWRIDLSVPYAEKDGAKALGARWDPAKKTWYAPPGTDLEPLKRWLPAGILEVEDQHGLPSRLDSPELVDLNHEVVTATEIAAFVYCQEQWRLQYGLGLSSESRIALDAGRRHHETMVAAERVASRSKGCGVVIVLLSTLVVASLVLW